MSSLDHRTAVLIKAAQDAAVLLDEIKDHLNSLEHADLAHSIIARIYLACEAVQATQTPIYSTETAL